MRSRERNKKVPKVKVVFDQRRNESVSSLDHIYAASNNLSLKHNKDLKILTNEMKRISVA